MADIKIDILVRDKSQQALGKLNNNLNQTKSTVFNLKNALIAIGSSVVLRQFFSLSNEFQNLQNRLKLVTNSTKELTVVQNELFEISRRTRGGFSETVELYQKLALQSQNLGLKNEELLQITENVNKVIGIAGVDAIQASAGILQLSQAFASGRLQGDEFRSISENIPPLLDIFAKELGVTRGELKKLGAEGKITSEIIATSLLKETDNIGKKFEKITPTIGQSTTRLRNSFVNLIGTFNEVTGTADIVSTSIIGISDAIDKLSDKTEQPKLLQGLVFAFSGILLDLDQIEKKLGTFAINFTDQDAVRDRYKVIKEIVKQEEKSAKRNWEALNYTRDIHTAYKPHKTNIEKVLEKLKEHNREYDLSNELFDGLISGTKFFARSLAESLILGKSLNMTFKELSQRILVDILSQTIERIALKGIEKLLDEYLFKKEQDKLNTMKAQESSLKRQIALQTVLSALGGGFGGFFGGFFANGGAVSKGQPIVVGEKGPEMFIPNTTGQITQSARGMGNGATTVNFNITTVDARGFDELLVSRRGTISRIINESVNERGREAII